MLGKQQGDIRREDAKLPSNVFSQEGISVLSIA